MNTETGKGEQFSEYTDIAKMDASELFDYTVLLHTTYLGLAFLSGPNSSRAMSAWLKFEKCSDMLHSKIQALEESQIK